MIEMGENQINNTENLFKAIYNDSPIGIELYDSNGRLIDLNQACLELFGVSSKDEVKGFDLLNDPNIPKEYLTKLKQRETIRYENIFDFELVKHKDLYKTAKSGKIYLDVLITPLFLGDNKSITNYLVQIQDISDRKIAEQKLIKFNDELENRIQVKIRELKKSEANWSILVEEAPDIIFTVDRNRRILYINKAPSGITREESIGKDILDYVSPEYHNMVKNSIEKVFQTGEPDFYEVSARGPNDISSWYSTRLGAIKQDDKIVSVMLITRDITEHKEIEQKLIESEEKFRSITEQSIMGICIVQDDIVKYANHQIADIYGYSIEEIMNWSPYEFLKTIDPEYRDIVVEQAKKKQLGQDDVIKHYQLKCIKKTGEKIWVDNYSRTINYNGKPADLVTLIDITEEKKAQEQLKESEEKYRLLTENLNDIITVVNDKGIAEYINEEAHKKVMGYSCNDIMYKNVFELIHPEDREKVIQEFKRLFKTGEGFTEARIFHKDGYYIWTETNGKTFIDNDGKLKILTITRDITERKKIEEKAKQEKEKAEMYLNLVNVIIVALDRDGNISMINKKGYDILGWNEGELIGKNWFENCLPQYDRNRVYDYFKKLMSGELDVVPFYENSVINKNKEEKLIAWSTILFKDSNGEINGLLSSGEDITEKKKAENELRESKQLLETTLYNLQDAIFILDDKIPPKVIECNPASEKIFGYSRDEIIGNTTAFLHVDDNSLKDFQETVLPKLQQDGNIQNFEFRMKRKNDKIFPTEHAISGLRNENGETLGIVSLVRDITERKKAEQELVRKNMEINTIFNTIPAMLNVVDREYNVINISNTFAKTFHNGKKDNAIGRKCYQAHKQRNNICPHCTVRKVFESGNIETRLSTPEEEALTGKSLKIYAAPIKDINGNISGAVEAIMDITDIKKAEEKIRESEKRLTHLLEAVPVGISITNLEGKIIECNFNMFKIFGYDSKDEFIEILASDHYSNPTDREKFIELSKKGIVKDFVVEFKRKDGSVFWGSLTSIAQKMGDQITFITSLQDITERKIADIKIQQSEAELSAIYNYAPIAILLVDHERRIRKINKFALKFTDRQEEEVFGIYGGEALRCVYSIIDPKGCGFSEYCQDCTIRNTVLDTLKTRTPYSNVEATLYLLPGGDTNKVHLLVSTVPLNFDGEDLVLISLIDITERKKAEERVQYQAKLVDNVSDAIISTDLEFNIISWNKAAESIYGWKVDESIGKNIADIIPVEYPSDDAEVVLKKFFEKGFWKGEVMQKHKNGTPINLLSSVSVIKDINGNPNGAVAINKDISERKKAEQSLKESEKRYKHLANELEMILDHVPGIIVFKDTENNIIRVNKYMADAHNLKKEDMEGKSSFEFYPYEEAQAYWEDDLEVVENKKPKFDIIEPWETLEGRRWVNTSKIPYIDEEGNVKGIIAIAFDITDRMKAEQELKESEMKYRDLFENSPIALFEQDFSELKTYLDDLRASGVSDFEKYLDENPDEIMNFTSMIKLIDINRKTVELYNVNSKDDFIKWKCKMEKRLFQEDMTPEVLLTNKQELLSLIHGETTFESEVVTKTFTGDKIYVYMKTLIIPGYEKTWSKVIVSLLDISDRIKTELKLKESEEKFRTIAEQSSLGMIIQQDGFIKFANSAVSDIIEYPLEKIHKWTAQETLQFIYKEDLPLIIDKLKQRQEGDFKSINQYECRAIAKSGKIKWINVYTKPIIYQGKNAVLSTFIDITEKKKVEEELKDVSRLKSDLISRTSHELKTPLVSIKGYADLLLSQHYEELDFYTISVLHEIKQGCYRLESLIKDLLETSELETGEVELNKLKDDLAFLIRFCVKDLKGLIETRKHNLILDIPENLVTLFEKERLYEVVINLLSNAIKYTPPNGRIIIKSESKDNNYIISIKDNGIGLTNEEKEKIFKKFGKIERYGKGLDVVSEGSGLGLYISKKIIELHGGDIWVESKGRDKGSKFSFSIPILKE